MEVCNVFFFFFINNLNTFCKEFYTCMRNITKKLSFLVEISYNVTITKGLIINYKLYNSATVQGIGVHTKYV